MNEEITKIRRIGGGGGHSSLYLLIPREIARNLASAKYWKIRVEEGGRRIIAEAVE